MLREDTLLHEWVELELRKKPVQNLPDGMKQQDAHHLIAQLVDDKDRTPDIPVDEQWRISIGLENQRSAGFRWGVNYTFAYLGDNDLDATNLAGRVVGDYDTPVHMFGLYGAWTF